LPGVTKSACAETNISGDPPLRTLAGHVPLKDLGLMAAAVNVTPIRPALEPTRTVHGAVPVEIA
jgi:hypothetical protein